MNTFAPLKRPAQLAPAHDAARHDASGPLAPIQRVLNGAPRATNLVQLAGAINARPEPPRPITGEDDYPVLQRASTASHVVQLMEEIGKIKRSGFSSTVRREAIETMNEEKGTTFKPKKTNLTDMNAALPHRLPYEYIERMVRYFANGEIKVAVFNAFLEPFLKGGADKVAALKSGDDAQQERAELVEKQLREIDIRAGLLRTAVSAKHRRDARTTAATKLVKAINNFCPNVPDLGPHVGVNIQVGARTHLHVEERKESSKSRSRSRSRKRGRGRKRNASGSSSSRSRSPRRGRRDKKARPTASLSPMSKAIVQHGDPDQVPNIAVSRADPTMLVSTDGRLHPISTLSKEHQKKIAEIGTEAVNVDDEMIYDSDEDKFG